MKSHVSFMTVVPAASLVPVPAALPSKPVLVARGETCHLPSSGESLPKPAGSWLVVDDEYFPFDADSFEER